MKRGRGGKNAEQLSKAKKKKEEKKGGGRKKSQPLPPEGEKK